MKTVKIFVASSIVEYEKERNELGARLRGLDDKYIDRGIHILLTLCEDESGAVTRGRRQDELNALVRESDFVFVIVGRRAGPATVEEFEEAYKAFRQNGRLLRPKIVVFFEDLPPSEREPEALRFRSRVRETLGQYPRKFGPFSEVERDILMELAYGGAFFDPAALEAARADHEAAVERIGRIRRENAVRARREELSLDDELEISASYQEASELARTELSGLSVLYDYAVFLHDRGRHAEAIEIGTELDALWTDEDDPDDRAALKDLIGRCYRDLGRLEDAEPFFGEAMELYRDLTEEDPDAAPDLASACAHLAEVLTGTLRFRAGEILCREALGLWLDSGGLEDCAFEIGSACHTLARALARTGRGGDGETLWRCAEAFTDYDADPSEAYRTAMDAARGILSDWLAGTEPPPDEATRLYREAEEQARERTKDDPAKYEQKLGWICVYRARWLQEHERMEDAETLGGMALGIFRDLAEDDPAQERNVAAACDELAQTLAWMRRPAETERLHREALSICRRLAETDPAMERGVAIAYVNLAGFLHRNDRMEEAERLYRRALSIFRRLAETDPAVERNLTTDLHDLAILLQETGRPREAVPLYREALSIFRRLAETDPAMERDVADSCGSLANDLRHIGRLEEAETLYQEALTIFRRLAETDPAAFEPDLARICFNLGVFEFENKHDRDAARAWFDEAAALLKKYPRWADRLDEARKMQIQCMI